jgi:hypothetical protein
LLLQIEQFVAEFRSFHPGFENILLQTDSDGKTGFRKANEILQNRDIFMRNIDGPSQKIETIPRILDLPDQLQSVIFIDSAIP